MNNKKTMNNKKVQPTTEIVGAFLQPHIGDLDLARFKYNPSDFLQKQGLDVMAVEIAVVENESSTVHLCLPYYESLAMITSDSIVDSDLADISGGEIVIGGTIGAAIGSAVAYGGGLLGAFIGIGIGGVAISALSLGAYAGGNAIHGKDFDGNPK